MVPSDLGEPRRERRTFAGRRRHAFVSAGRMDAQRVAGERDVDGAVAVGAIGADVAPRQAVERLGRRMAVVVVGADRDDGDRGTHRVEEGVGRRRPRPVVGDLQHVDPREPALHERRIEVLLEIAHQQESARARLAEEHDRGVVDGLAIRRRSRGDGAGVGPQDSKADAVERQPVAGDEPASRRPAGGEEARPRVVGGSLAREPGLVDAPDAVLLQHGDQPRRMVLVGVRQHEDVDPAVPGRQPLVQVLQQPVRVGAAIDDEAPAGAALDEDRVALTDVEDHEPRDVVGAMTNGQGEREGRASERRRADALRARAGIAPRGRPASGTGRRRGWSWGRGWSWRRTSCWRGLSWPSAAQALDKARAPANAAADQAGRGDRRNHVPRRIELDAGERQARSRPHRGDHPGVERPCRQADDRREERGQASAGEHASNEGERTGGHRRRDQRHDHEVDEWRDQREAAEVQQDDWRRRGLGGEGHAEDLSQPAAWAARLGPGEAARQRRAPGQDPGRRQDRQAEAGVADPGRVEEQQRRHRPAQGRGRRPGTAELAREQRDTRHDAGADHGRRGPDERDVDDDRQGGENGSAAPPKPACDGAEGGRDDRDVPARDRDDVARPGGREVRRQLPIDTVPQPDQHAGRQAGLGLGHRPRQALGRDPAHVLERRAQGVLGGQDREALGAKRADRADPGEIGAVVIGRRRADPTAELDVVTRNHRREPGQGRRDQRGGIRRELDDGGSGTGSGCADALDDPAPGPIAGWELDRPGGWCRPGRATSPDDEDPEADRGRPPGANVPTGSEQGNRDREQAARGEHDGDRRQRREGECAGRGADREPRRSRHG